MDYNFSKIEKKWQNFWDENHTFKAKDDFSLKKYYPLVEFPYPSGQGLHVGHPRSYTALDIIARKRRLEGYNVLYPMGWDAFGLPTENFAIKNHVHPKDVTDKNIAKFKSQLKSLGISFDWDREINTTDPSYYKWTQWIFIKLFEKGLAYKKDMAVNWCTSCNCVLANEEVVNGKCERCSSKVIRKNKSQWMLKITEYANRLLEDLKDVDYINPVKIQQENWIGKSEGALVKFKTNLEDEIEIFTTRPDTLFGATYMVLSPEHPLIENRKNNIKNWDEVSKYQELSAQKSEFERDKLNKEKTGVKLDGIVAINPVNSKKIPIYISDYVLMSYGTGAIMAVPAHDERDFSFAKKFGIEIIDVVDRKGKEQPFTDTSNGKLINSEFLNGLNVKDAKEKMIEYLEKNNLGKRKTNFKLRDWVFARQRYWGEPIPIVYCDECGTVPLKEEDLPLILPEIDSYEPSKDGQSPLYNLDSFVNTTCPKCGGHAKRETDTMPQWAGSSWYYLRYLDPHCDDKIAKEDLINYWMPVDWYNGGMEHTTLHLLYSRFWHKFLYDIGIVNTKEPYKKRTSHGMILGENGEKMSKSRGNIINPDDIIKEYGADTMRLYEMFIGDFEKSAPWSTKSIKGCKRFLDKVYSLHEKLIDGGIRNEMETPINKMIKKVSLDIEILKFNTAIAAMMTFLNEIPQNITKEEFKILLILLNPFAPHITEELWCMSSFEGYVHEQNWPKYDESKCQEDQIEIAVSICGKVRAKIIINNNASKDEALSVAKCEPKIKELIKDKTIIKEIFVPNKLINLVVK